MTEWATSSTSIRRRRTPSRHHEELGDDVIARLNQKNGEIENLEVLFFTTRLLRGDLFEPPVTAHLRPADTA